MFTRSKLQEIREAARCKELENMNPSYKAAFAALAQAADTLDALIARSVYQEDSLDEPAYQACGESS